MGRINRHTGFTLAELLVVVAIIGVLVAVAIPVFSNQLEKSRDAVTVANLRNAYAEAQTAYLTQTSSPDGRVEYVGDYKGTIGDDGETESMVVVKNVVAKGKKENSFSGLAESLPFVDTMKDGTGNYWWFVTQRLDAGGNSANNKYEIQFKYNKSGELYVVQPMDNTK